MGAFIKSKEYSWERMCIRDQSETRASGELLLKVKDYGEGAFEAIF